MRNKLFVVILLIGSLGISQNQSSSYFDLNFFQGNIALHNNDILPLITGRPSGFILGWNKKTFGKNSWEQRYNYPDYGLTFVFQDFKNPILGYNYGLYAHYNFYFFKRHFMFRIGQGIAFASNPYDKIENPKNVAFGSDILSATLVMLNFKKERLVGNFGVMAGVSLLHYSNANVRAPNTSVNSVTFNVGVNYNLNDTDEAFISNLTKEKFTEPLRINLVFRSGINESDVVGSGQFPFYVLSAYADKRLSDVSALQFGSDVFFSNFLKELIYYESVSFPELEVSGDEDYKRVGLFVGHELFINRLSVLTQFGYYVYYPYDFEGRTYIRAGLKYYLSKSLFTSVSLKSHGAKAEALEFGLGIRL